MVKINLMWVHVKHSFPHADLYCMAIFVNHKATNETAFKGPMFHANQPFSLFFFQVAVLVLIAVVFAAGILVGHFAIKGDTSK